MYYIHSMLAPVLLLVSFASMASGSETITFASEDGLLMTADVYAPYANGEAPVVVLFHQAGWIQETARHITVPVFITSSRNEADGWAAIFEGIEPGQKVAFIPVTEGRHGLRASWKKYPDSEAYRNAVQVFLERYIPAS